jgi:hypothetical protein
MMGKYQSYSQKQDPKPDRNIHPIWRGIGFAMIVLIPFLSYVGMRVLLQENQLKGWFPLPQDLLVNWRDPLILIEVLITIAIAFVLYILFMLVTFMMNRVFAPPRYGPTDVPPESYRGKKRLR